MNFQAQPPDHVCHAGRLGADALAQHPATPAGWARTGARSRSLPLAECLLCGARAALLGYGSCFCLSVLSQVRPRTGEPDAGDPPSGSEGGEPSRSVLLPLSRSQTPRERKLLAGRRRHMGTACGWDAWCRGMSFSQRGMRAALLSAAALVPLSCPRAYSRSQLDYRPRSYGEQAGLPKAAASYHTQKLRIPRRFWQWGTKMVNRSSPLQFQR